MFLFVFGENWRHGCLKAAKQIFHDMFVDERLLTEDPHFLLDASLCHNGTCPAISHSHMADGRIGT